MGSSILFLIMLLNSSERLAIKEDYLGLASSWGFAMSLFFIPCFKCIQSSKFIRIKKNHAYHFRMTLLIHHSTFNTSVFSVM